MKEKVFAWGTCLGQWFLAFFRLGKICVALMEGEGEIHRILLEIESNQRRIIGLLEKSHTH